jgi:regulatory protein
MIPITGRLDPWDVAVRLLAGQALTTRELQQRLVRRGYASDQIDVVIAKLTASRYLDDAEYAKSWARSRAHRRSVGPARLAQELHVRGIAEEQIAAALKEAFVERDVREVAEAAALRKLRSLRDFTPEVARRRLAAHLTRQGFSAEIVLALCQKHLPRGEDPNDQ